MTMTIIGKPKNTCFLIGLVYLSNTQVYLGKCISQFFMLKSCNLLGGGHYAFAVL